MTNGAPNHDPSGQPTRPVDDAEWFWTREAFEATAPQQVKEAALPEAHEPTQVIPTHEPTQVIPAQEDTRVLDPVDETRILAPLSDAADGAGRAESTVQMPLALSAAIGSAAARAAHPVTGQTAHSGPQPDQFPQSAWGAPSGQPVGAPQQPRRSGGAKALVAVFAASLLTGMAVMPALSHTAGQLLPGGGSSTQPAPAQGEPSTGTAGPQDGTPAEQQPWDPWGTDQQGQQGQQDQQDPWQGSEDGTTNEQQAGSSTQSQPSSAQSKGVVLIQATTSSGRSAGTGMVITDNGYVLTNYHVVQSSTALRAQVASTQQSYTATVVGHDASNDVALLKLEGATGLDTVKIDDDQLATGDAVTAVGNANGQGYLSAAPGKVTDMASSITVSNETSASGKEELTDVIKTTAGAQPGDSGGPMFDAEGEVVGMTTAGQQASSGIRTQNTTIASYAVPIERAMGIINQIRSGNESGTVKIGPKAYLGVSVRTLDDGSIGVASVVSGGPAATAGLRPGDLITSLDGTSITSHAALSEVLAGKEPGDRVTLTWLDGSGSRQSAEVTLASSPMN